MEKSRDELLAELAEKEAQLEADKAQQAADFQDNLIFGILGTGWQKAVREGTVDWQDLEGRLEACLAKVRERLSP